MHRWFCVSMLASYLGTAVGLACAATGSETRRRAVPWPSGAPLETARPNVPGFKPAFPGQTRAPAIRTRTAIRAVSVASGFDHPWAIAFLPDGRMLVTEKPSGRLYQVDVHGK